MSNLREVKYMLLKLVTDITHLKMQIDHDD